VETERVNVLPVEFGQHNFLFFSRRKASRFEPWSCIVITPSLVSDSALPD
jgi:hypothetical protein